MVLARIIRIDNPESLVRMLIAFAEIFALLYLTYFLCSIITKRFFSKWFEGKYILNKALPFYAIAVGLVVAYRLIISLLETSVGFYYILD